MDKPHAKNRPCFSKAEKGRRAVTAAVQKRPSFRAAFRPHPHTLNIPEPLSAHAARLRVFCAPQCSTWNIAGKGRIKCSTWNIKTPRSKPPSKRTERPAPVGHMPPTPKKMNSSCETRQGMAAADRGREHSAKRKTGPMINGEQGYTSIHRKRKRPEQGGHDRQRQQGWQKRKFPGASQGEKAHSPGGTEVARTIVRQRLRGEKQGKGPSGELYMKLSVPTPAPHRRENRKNPSVCS